MREAACYVQGSEQNHRRGVVNEVWMSSGFHGEICTILIWASAAASVSRNQLYLRQSRELMGQAGRVGPCV